MGSLRDIRNGKWVLWVLCALVLTWPGRISHGGEAFPEYKVKAAFLFNFLRFVEWPKQAFRTGEEPLMLAVLGTDPFGETLEETFRGKLIQGRTVKIERLSEVSGTERMHLLFLARSEKARISEALAKLQDSPVLTVSEVEDFVRDGGMIQLKVVDQQVTFDLNQKVIKTVGLIPNAQMIRIAKVVRY